MPRIRRPAYGALGQRLEEALRARELTPLELAAAARVHKGTLYKMLDGRTSHPHLSTLRRLCKVLQIDLYELLDREQLELITRGSTHESLSEIEELLVAEIRTFPPSEQKEATEHALFAVLEVQLGMGRGAPARLYDELRSRRSPSPEWLEGLLRQQLREVPRESRIPAVQAALGGLVDLRILRARSALSTVPSRCFRLKYRLSTPKEKPKRQVQPQSSPSGRP